MNNRLTLRRVYYEIWADSIEAADKLGRTEFDKRFTLLPIFTIGCGFNIATIILPLSPLVGFDFFIPIDVLPGGYLDSAFSGFVTLFFPIGLINYYLIFYRKGFKAYMNGRRINTGGKAIIYYLLFSLLVFLTLLFALRLYS